jgi:Helicase conserved C-terminal domain/DEAD/DEAH box helicase
VAGPDVEALHEQLDEPGSLSEDPFALLRDVAHAHALAEAEAASPADEELRRARELIIRLVDRREELDQAVGLHDALLSKIGLYPYLRPDDLAGADLFAYEAHHPPGTFGENFVWHREQAYAYALLLDGQNVVLSAPTSFGKSRVIDGVLASGKFPTVLLIVPTIALIDETRRRLSRLLGDSYKVVTHVGQETGPNTVYVLTQERVLEFEELPEVDLFVIDEFYKLAMEEDENGDIDHRARLLNLAFFRLWRTGAQFYLLGPNIGAISPSTLSRLDCTWLNSWDTTVSVEVIARLDDRDKDERFFEVASECAGRSEPTLVYCSSPGGAEALALRVAEAGLGRPDQGADEAGRWMAGNYHPRWRAAKAIQGGVAVHHGQLPRALGQYAVAAFEREEVNFLICTPTLIEGVNTKAKNVVIYDQKIGAETPIDLFTYNNIRGRTGRMSAHISGRVYVFEEPPVPPLKEIDIPILSQSDEAPPELFLGLDEGDVAPGPRDRLEEMLAASEIDRSIFEESPTIGLEDQLKLGAAIEAMSPEDALTLSWGTAYPQSDEIRPIFELVFDDVLSAGRKGRHPFGAISASQLVVWIDKLSRGSSVRSLLEEQVDYAESEGHDPDDFILSVLKFLRSGLSFEAPRWLRAADAIQKVVLLRHGWKTGDYEPYIGRLENLFLAYPLAALDEYGVPVELIRKIAGEFEGIEEIDPLLDRFSAIDPDSLGLSAFETLMVRSAQDGLGAPSGSGN